MSAANLKLMYKRLSRSADHTVRPKASGSSSLSSRKLQAGHD